MPCYSIDGLRPVVHPDSFVHPTAILIGDVIIAEDCYIAPSAVMRGDFGRLILERGSNLQDNCVMHGFPGTDTIIEQDGHIGHGAMLHGCHIGKNAMVGMNSVVMDGASIGHNSIVAAMSFVKAEMVVPDNHLVVGNPAKIKRKLTKEEISWKLSGTQEYQRLVYRSIKNMVEVIPLTKPESNRPRINIEDTVSLNQFRRNNQ